MIEYERILKECFWDMDISKETIKNIVNGKNIREKSFLFDKIIKNSGRLFIDLNIFKKEELEKLIENYKVPNFNKNYISRRKNLAEVYFLNKPLLIDELKWIV